MRDGVNLAAGETLDRRVHSLGATPLAVVTAGHHDAEWGPVPRRLRYGLDRLWATMQNQLATLSSNGCLPTSLGGPRDSGQRNTGRRLLRRERKSSKPRLGWSQKVRITGTNRSLKSSALAQRPSVDGKLASRLNRSTRHPAASTRAPINA